MFIGVTHRYDEDAGFVRFGKVLSRCEGGFLVQDSSHFRNRVTTVRVPFSREELLTLAMLVIMNVLILVTGNVMPALRYFILNFALILVIVTLAYRPPRWTWVRDWYIIVYLLVIFFETGTLVPLINPHEMDTFVIAADRVLCGGVDPSLLLGQWVVPAAVEILQLVYASFYLLPVILCLLLYIHKDREGFHVCAFAILLGFYSSYLGFFLCPVLGPRFTLEHLQTKPLQGLWSYEYVRTLLAWMEGKMYDCMPSGHALVSLLTALLARRYYRPFYGWASIWAILMIIATIYLRYHYVLDVIVGIILAIIIYLILPKEEARELRALHMMGRS